MPDSLENVSGVAKLSRLTFFRNIRHDSEGDTEQFNPLITFPFSILMSSIKWPLVVISSMTSFIDFNMKLYDIIYRSVLSHVD